MRIRWPVGVTLLVTTLIPGAARAAQFQQTGTLAGVVRDGESRLPLSGVVIELEGSGVSAITDADGRFVLQAAAGALVVRAALVGFGRARAPATIVAGEVREIEILLMPGTAPYTERLLVRGDEDRSPPGVSAFRLGGGELLALRGVIADDPFRAVQAAPGVAAGDDFRAEFAMRGHGPRHIGITIDGMDTRLLTHSVRGIADTGSLAIFNTDVLAGVDLVPGAQPQRDAGRLGARVTFHLRDGARDRFTWRGSISGTAASVIAEGPLGGGRTASYLVSLRRSYLDWLIRRIDPEVDETFGFVDGLARVAWQPSPRHTLRATVIGARSALRETDGEGGRGGPNSLDEGRSTTSLANLEWLFIPGARAVLTQRVWMANASYRNETPAGAVRESGFDRERAYRADVAWTLGPRVTAEGGVRLGWSRARREAQTFSGGVALRTLDRAAEEAAHGAWAGATLRVTPAATLTGGVRGEWSRQSDAATASPWVMGELRVGGATTMRAGVAAQRQQPDIEAAAASPIPLRPERATLVDVALERRAGGWRLLAGAYGRVEADRLREGGELVVRDHAVRRRIAATENRFDGEAWGVELLAERRRALGISGWIGYAYGHSRLDDGVTGERFDADFDQRHAAALFIAYRHSARTSANLRWRIGSNFPLAGYFERLGETYYLAGDRNRVRLPLYSRLDLRADRTFTIDGRRLTLFLEVVNVLHRRNLGPGNANVNLRTGVVRNAVEALFPILPSAGLLVEW